jgi:transcriptional regulator with XRE-family HTH domain
MRAPRCASTGPARGFTQAKLAARAGASGQLVVAVETGGNRPAVDAALRLTRTTKSSGQPSRSESLQKRWSLLLLRNAAVRERPIQAFQNVALDDFHN